MSHEAQLVSAETLHIFLDWLTRIVTATSILLTALHWLEGLIEIWIPRNADSWFWTIYKRMKLSLRYISLSPQSRNGLQQRNDKSPERIA